MEKVFRTKNGYCHILPDKVVLTRSQSKEAVLQAQEKNTIGWRLVLYAVFAIYLFYKMITLFKEGETVRYVLHGFAGFLLLYIIYANLNNSSTNVIMRDRIKSVKFNPASAATRTYFTIIFEDHNGKAKKRLIMLPGSMTGGKEESARAYALMSEEGLI